MSSSPCASFRGSSRPEVGKAPANLDDVSAQRRRVEIRPKTRIGQHRFLKVRLVTFASLVARKVRARWRHKQLRRVARWGLPPDVVE